MIITRMTGSDPNVFAIKISDKYNPINFDSLSIEMVLPTKKRKARQEEEGRGGR